MRLHKNARLTPILREEMARRIVHEHLPLNRAASKYKISSKTAAKWARRYTESGPGQLFDRSCRPFKSPRRLSPELTDEECKAVLVSLLHRPPAEFEINRTSWRLVDLHRLAAENGAPISRARMRRVLKSTGFCWRRARTVLTSKDPEYAEKVTAIKRILAGLKSDEAFFSIDEYGPFSIKKKGGRKRVGPGEKYTIPQWQKSKGSLILTAALELSRNQVTHFYSAKKNTEEMIRMADMLRAQYANCSRIYLSWDSAAWHVSKKLKEHLAELNINSAGKFPVLEVAPLPAGAQFLNVIESVFSGMARAIMHNSDYPSVEYAKAAIDKYFQTRNAFFEAHPDRAGKTIWRSERVPVAFSDANNCKDPRYS